MRWMIFCRISGTGKKYIGFINVKTAQQQQTSRAAPCQTFCRAQTALRTLPGPMGSLTVKHLIKRPPTSEILLWKVLVYSIKTTTPSSTLSCWNLFACPHPLGSPPCIPPALCHAGGQHESAEGARTQVSWAAADTAERRMARVALPSPGTLKPQRRRGKCP